MSDLRSKLIRLAHARPELRPALLPLLRTAMEHSSPEALKQYLKDHPDADPKNHTVGKAKKDSPSKKSLESSELSSDTKKSISAKMDESPDSFRDKSPGKAKVKNEGESADFEPPGYLRDFAAASSSSKDDEAAEAAMKEWAASKLDMSPKDLDEWYDLEITDSKSGAFRATMKPSMKKGSDLRSKVIRLAHTRPELRPALLPLLKSASKAKVVVRGGKEIAMSEDALREFLDDKGGIKDLYKSSDNLPKWMAGSKALKLRGWKGVAEAIQKILDSSGPVTVNVRSDEPRDNKIQW